MLHSNEGLGKHRFQGMQLNIVVRRGLKTYIKVCDNIKTFNALAKMSPPSIWYFLTK